MRQHLKYLLFCLLAAVATLAAPAHANAAKLDTAIEKLLTDSYPDTDAAVTEIVTSGAPQAPAILDALADRRVQFSTAAKSVTYSDAAGKVFDAATGLPIPAAPADAQLVRVNNRLRGSIAAAIGTLTLLSPDPAKRLAAARISDAA